MPDFEEKKTNISLQNNSLIKEDVCVIKIVTSGCSHTFDLSVSSDFAQKYFLLQITPAQEFKNQSSSLISF